MKQIAILFCISMLFLIFYSLVSTIQGTSYTHKGWLYENMSPEDRLKYN